MTRRRRSDALAFSLALTITAARLREAVRPAMAAADKRLEADSLPRWAGPLADLAYTAEAAAAVIYAAGCELRGLAAAGMTLAEFDRVLCDLDGETPVRLSVTEAGRRWLEEHAEDVNGGAS